MNFYTQVWHIMHTKVESINNQELICWPKICHYTWSSKDFTCLHDIDEMWSIKDNLEIYYSQ
jgi:hypothetical protein